ETTFDVLSGKSDNLHQSVLATQEAGIAFTLLLEVRNKLVDGFRELTRMSI
ncbi:MAG: flagellar hook-basal body complex protein FliE, partial [bacterium]